VILSKKKKKRMGCQNDRHATPRSVLAIPTATQPLPVLDHPHSATATLLRNNNSQSTAVINGSNKIQNVIPRSRDPPKSRMSGVKMTAMPHSVQPTATQPPPVPLPATATLIPNNNNHSINGIKNKSPPKCDPGISRFPEFKNVGCQNDRHATPRSVLPPPLPPGHCQCHIEPNSATAPRTPSSRRWPCARSGGTQRS
jgi:hypothetical protein